MFATSLLLMLLDFCKGSTIGVCYGRNADDLPTPDKVAQLVKLHNIKYLRIYDANIQVLKAFANTGVELMVGIANLDLLPFSQFQSNADTWLKNNILPYYPATKITYITVGAEVTEASNNVSSMVVPAMHNVQTALKKAGLHRKIKVSTTHSLGVLSRSFPPSAGAFNSSHAFFLKPLLEFLAENQSPFMVDIYPYYAYSDSRNNVSLGYALLSRPLRLSTQILLNYRTIKIMVTETGWPSKGSAKEKAATPDNAQTYNTNLIRHVINDTGTPAKSGQELDVYVFSLFNENRKPGLESERNWGLFYPDQTSVYSLDFTGKGAVDTTTREMFPVRVENGVLLLLQLRKWIYRVPWIGLVVLGMWTVLLFSPQNAATDIACGFGGAGVKTNKNPSYDKCLYMTAGSNKTATSNGTTTAARSTSSSAQTVSSLWVSTFLLLDFILFC
ncbi:hypothetical protein C3L33_19374, partial [Rhododendron williamsianum]